MICSVKKYGFTLAEILITLGIIGVVCAITIPTLIQNTQDAELKTAYKKAYSDLSQMFIQNLQEGNWPSRAAVGDTVATASEWAVIRSGFKVTKDCDADHLNDCWVSNETIWGSPEVGVCSSFIDASGRVWVQYSQWENIYLLDTNGSKGPNHFGKDRWLFTLQNADGSRVSTGLPTKIGNFTDDQPASNVTCHYPPCYYKSWLFN